MHFPPLAQDPFSPPPGFARAPLPFTRLPSPLPQKEHLPNFQLCGPPSFFGQTPDCDSPASLGLALLVLDSPTALLLLAASPVAFSWPPYKNHKNSVNSTVPFLFVSALSKSIWSSLSLMSGFPLRSRELISPKSRVPKPAELVCPSVFRESNFFRICLLHSGFSGCFVVLATTALHFRQWPLPFRYWAVCME